MTTIEETARRIASRGREALVARLRPAFEEAASAQADVLQLEPAQLDALIQEAADRADGLQWRRALAAVAAEDLGIGLGEAINHPAVERAQILLGAPSYEEALAKLGPIQEPDAPPEPEAEETLAPAVAVAEPFAEPLDEVRLAAVHLHGIANLEASAADIELMFTPQGLDIIREEKSIGRLPWDEVRMLEVPDTRTRLRRGNETRLVVRTDEGEASFRVPSLNRDELRAYIDALNRFIPTAE